MIYDEETIDEIQLHKGKYYNKKRSKTNGRVIRLTWTKLSDRLPT